MSKIKQDIEMSNEEEGKNREDCKKKNKKEE